jgi:hypothetical protein
MCLPVKNDQSDASEPGARSIRGLGVLMLFACLARPALAGAIGGFGALVYDGRSYVTLMY